MWQPGKRISFGVSVAVIVLSAMGSALAEHGPDWPSFRGHRGDGVSAVEAVFPASGDFSLSVAWKIPIGSGYSGVTIVGDLAVTMFAAGASDVIAAFDTKSGVEQWRYAIDKSFLGQGGAHTGPVSTPCIDDGNVYGLGPRGKLFALKVATGESLWMVDLVATHEAAMSPYGFATSPFVREGVLVVEGGAKDAAITGFDPRTGELLWKAGKDEIYYQSPIDFTVNGRAVLLAPGNTKLFAVAPKTGEIVWEFSHRGSGSTGARSLSPVAIDESRVFLSSQVVSSWLFGVRDVARQTSAKVIWRTRSIHNSYNVPVYHNGHLYGFSDRFLGCTDVANGDSVWRSRTPGDGFLILADGHLVMVTKRGGVVSVAKATPDGFTSAASVSVFDDGVWTNPSFADGSIFARSLGELARVDIQRGSRAASASNPVHHPVNAGRFERSLSELAKARNKKAAVNKFMASVGTFPMIDGNRVHFLYRGKGDDLAVGSDLFGMMYVRRMTQVAGTDLFYLTTEAELDARVSYIFIRNFKDHITDPNNKRRTRGTVYDQEMGLNVGGPRMEMSWFAMPKWKSPNLFAARAKVRKGTIDRRSFTSKAIAGSLISIDVYLPAVYQQGSDAYPVAYFHGGGLAMKHGQVPQTLDNLIGREVRPVIVAFIKVDQTFLPPEYKDMFISELVPYIDKNFRTIPSAESRASIGTLFHSEAAFVAAFSNPDVIGKVATESFVTFFSDRVTSVIKTAAEQPIEVFMEWGKYDLRCADMDLDAVQFNRDLEVLLRERGFHFQGGEINEGTGWTTWRDRIDAIFKALFPLGRG